jgi:hypothetical protein
MFEPVGADVNLATIIVVSVATVAEGNANVTGIDDVTPTRAGEYAPTVMLVASRSVFAAEAGATEDNRPKPIAVTATSAMRLKLVFVDICFLSISRSREFLPFGLKLKFLTSVR